MPLSPKPCSEWTREDLDALIAAPPAVESATLDFKADCRLLDEKMKREEKQKARQDLLKDIASMANGGGGVLMLGVRQTGDSGKPPQAARIDGIREPDRLTQSIEALVASHLDVRPPPLRYYPIRYEDGRYVLIAEVPQNTHSLSMVTIEGLNQFWVRRGTDNRAMTTDEIQFVLARLTRLRDEAESELGGIRKELPLNRTAPSAWYASVPLHRARDAVPARADVLDSMLVSSASCFYRITRGNPHYDFDPLSVTMRGKLPCHPAEFSGKLRPFLKGLKWRTRDGHGRLEVWRDGTVVLTQPIEARVMHIYAIGATGLGITRDLQDLFGVGPSIGQVGLMGVRYRELHEAQDAFADDELDLDRLMIDPTEPVESVFRAWAQQLANSVGHEDPWDWEPWV